MSLVETISRRLCVLAVSNPGGSTDESWAGYRGSAEEIIRDVLEFYRDHASDKMKDAGEDALFEATIATNRWLSDCKAKTGGLPFHVTRHAHAGFKAMLSQAIVETNEGRGEPC